MDKLKPRMERLLGERTDYRLPEQPRLADESARR
jgi:hypothetical protein